MTGTLDVTLDPAAPSVDKDTGAAVRVLVVEDDPATRVLLEGVLGAAGYAVRSAGHASEALALAADDAPDIVLTDILMPGMSGLELIRRLRADARWQGTYIVVITVVDATDRLVEAFEHGANDYVIKPLDARVLRARLLAGVRTIRLQRALDQRNRELAAALERTQALALTDVLTGLPNRRYAIGRLEQELAVAARSSRPLSLLMLDIDHFKGVNDRYGHAAGDAVLVEVAQRLRRAARQTDVVCRIGGEEFVLIAPDTDAHRAAQVAERLREVVAAQPCLLPQGLGLTITLSAGVAQLAPRAAARPGALDALFARADDALYQAKRAGRDRVVVAAAPPGSEA
jgi:diguanylate cyclase (GGDEF)-like protein